MEPFKNKINPPLIRQLASASRKAWPKFDAIEFAKAAEQDLDQMELKARVDHVVRRWKDYLPSSYPPALKIVLNTLPPEFHSESGWGDSIFYTWLHSHFVQIYGLEHPELSFEAMLAITKRGSSEFSVRPFLRRHGSKTRAFLKKHLKHSNPHVRRWISEGTRPRLPWGEQLKDLVADPTPNLPLLQALRKDESLYVRTSVANHLGDIAKDHPELSVKTLQAWLAENFEHAPWIAKKSLRHLIKQGHPAALKVLGFSAGTKAHLEKFTLKKTILKVGEALEFEFILKGGAKEKLNVDYAIDFAGAKGRKNRKVFKLSAKEIKKGESLNFAKRHSIKVVTTRKLILGEQDLTIMVNGKELKTVSFIIH